MAAAKDEARLAFCLRRTDSNFLVTPLRLRLQLRRKCKLTHSQLTGTITSLKSRKKSFVDRLVSKCF